MAQSKTINKNLKIQKAIDFIEEFAWLLDANKMVDIKALPALLRENIPSLLEGTGKYASPNPNKHFLIGVLPRLFQDLALFPTNEDIADFARSVLHIAVPRSEKRSKYELIGLIVCSTNGLNDEKLSYLVTALQKITNSEEKINQIIEARKNQTMSWNDAIEQIGGIKPE